MHSSNSLEFAIEDLSTVDGLLGGSRELNAVGTKKVSNEDMLLSLTRR